MVTVVNWPGGVPDCIEPLSPQGGLVDNRLSFSTDAPIAPIERPATSWAPEVYSVELVPMSIDQFSLFQLWYKNDLRYGVMPFRWYHPITKTVGAWKIQRGEPPYDVRKIGTIPHLSARRRISVSFTVESYPVSIPTVFLAQEQSDLVLQEQEDRIVVDEGHDFHG